MNNPLRLYYAPDNASLCVRLALEGMAVPYETTLVDRKVQGQRDAAYLAKNPNGLIPVLATPQGPLFETGAILLWLADSRPGTLMPTPDETRRGPALTWLFWLANTLHATLRMLFYPDVYCPTDTAGLRNQTRQRLRDLLRLLDTEQPDFLTANHLTAQGCYLAPMLRWCGLYGGDTSWFDLADTPRLADFAQRFEVLPSAVKASQLEGLGPTPFSAPRFAQPLEGSAV